MFLGPLEAVKPWNTKGLEGPYRFLQRVWRLLNEEGKKGEADRRLGVADEALLTRDLERRLHKTIRKVSEDIDKLRLNTAIASLMELQGALSELPSPRPRGAVEAFVKLLSPFAPHLAEELWQLGGHAATIAYEPWPEVDPALLVETEQEIAVQVAGKLRGSVMLPTDADEASALAAALAVPAIQKYVGDKPPRRVIFVRGRLLNIVPG
jgi:leucyl-tRNA synthetase